jgi:cob(I)alamin adenosyltransferase
MGQRLTRIYTRTGDDGSTGLGDGSRVAKDSARVEALGAVDELNSALGTILAHGLPDLVRQSLVRVQNDLFDLGGEISVPGRAVLAADRIRQIERLIDTLNSGLPTLREFILPGGGPAAAHCHLARAIGRRAERRLVTLARAESVNPHTLEYVNRLSDLLFVVARVVARDAGAEEVFWTPGGGGG